MSGALPSAAGRSPAEAAERRRTWIGCGATFAFAAGTLVAGADLAATTRFGPGPGFFVKGLAVAMLALALIQAVGLWTGGRRLTDHAEPTPDRPEAVLVVDEHAGDEGFVVDRGRLLRFSGLAVSLVLYGLLIEPLGFLVSTTLLAFAAMTMLGRAPWRSAAEAVAGVLATYLLLHGLLGVNLPDAALAPLAAIGL